MVFGFGFGEHTEAPWVCRPPARRRSTWRPPSAGAARQFGCESLSSPAAMPPHRPTRVSVYMWSTHTIRNTHLADSTQDTLASLHRTPTCLFISYTARTTLSLSLSSAHAQSQAAASLARMTGGLAFRDLRCRRERGVRLSHEIATTLRDRTGGTLSHLLY